MDRKIALITGGSSGIGKAIAIELAKNGIEVIINFSTSESKAKEVQEEITMLGGKAHIFQADITAQEGISGAFSKIREIVQD